MGKNKIIGVIGGDKRQLYLINLLSENGYIVKVHGFEKSNLNLNNVVICNDIADAINNSDYIVLGLPITKKNAELYAPYSNNEIPLDDILLYINEYTTVFGGRIPSEFINMATKKNVSVIDYSKDELFAYLNSVPTAEGCIAQIINDSPLTIDSMNCLITGFGKCAKILAYKLKKLNAEVTIAARSNNALSEAMAYGYNACKLSNLNKVLCNYNTVINTVDAPIFTREILDCAYNDALFIDIASFPGGIDFEYASRKKLKAIHLLGIPAKTAPYTAGEIIFRVINNAIKEDIYA